MGQVLMVMPIYGNKTITMLNLYHISISILDSRKYDNSGTNCLDYGATFTGNIHAMMEALFTSKRVAPFAKFHEVHMYVDPWGGRVETEQFWMEALELEKVDRGGNMYLVWPYYKHGAFCGVREVHGVSVVSDIQLYIDLYNFPIRGREQAEHLMRKRLSYLTNATFEQ